MNTAYCVNWTEYERGFGHRPDGHTLHANKEIMQKYLDTFAEKAKTLAKEKGFSFVPDEYSVPGEPFIVEVTEEEFKQIQEKGTIWGHVNMHRSR